MFCFSLLPVVAVVLVVVRSSVLRLPSVVAVSWLSAASFPLRVLRVLAHPKTNRSKNRESMAKTNLLIRL